MLPGESEVFKDIAAKHARAIRAMTKLHDVAVRMLTHAPWMARKRGSSPVVDWTIAGLFTKATKTFRSIQVLCERGLTEDATALVRVLYETHVAILFILQRRSKERADMYHAHMALQERKEVEHWRRTRGLKRGATKMHLKTVQQLVDHWTSLIPPSVDVKRHWSGKGSLEAAATALRGSAGYASIYRYASSFTHSTDFGAYVEQDVATGKLVVAVDPSARSVDGTAAVAREILWFTARRINERFKFGFEKRLRPLNVKKRDFPE